MSEYVNYDGLKRYDELIKNVISDTNTWRPVSDSVSSTDSSTAASSKAVKMAYDLAASKTSLGYTETTTGITNLDATLISTALRKTAQTLTAAEQAQVKQNLDIRNIIISTSEPTNSDGNDGDIWLVYES